MSDTLPSISSTQELPQQTGQPGQPQNNQGMKLLSNKRFIFLSIAGIILLLIIFSIIFIASNKNSSQTKQPSQTEETFPASTISPKPSEQISNVENEEIKNTIKTQAKPQIDNIVQDIPYTISAVKTYGKTWSMIEITNPTTDPANIILENRDNAWTVVLGPGTHFDAEELQNIGAPQDLINDANSRLSTNGNDNETPTPPLSPYNSETE